MMSIKDSMFVLSVDCSELSLQRDSTSPKSVGIDQRKLSGFGQA
jgi:hypothetical protein